MHLRLKTHILVQSQLNGDLAILDLRNHSEAYWVASGLAADAILLIQNGIAKDALLKALEHSYEGPRNEIKKCLDELIASLAEQELISTRTRSALTLKSLLAKSKINSSKQSSNAPRKKRLTSAFRKNPLPATEILSAMACLSDVDCPPGSYCVLGADMCTQFCAST